MPDPLWERLLVAATGPAITAVLALKRLDEAYQHARVKGQTIEGRLLIYYESEVPARSWHQVFDLLSVRYFLLFEHDGERRRTIRERNAGEGHSGLTSDELNDPLRLLQEIRDAIAKAVEALWQYSVDRQGQHLRRGRGIRWGHSEHNLDADDATG